MPTTGVQIMDGRHQLALGTKTGTTSWDNGDELDITANGTIVPEFLHVYTAQDVHLICDLSTDPPSTDPAVYVADQTHIIPCLNKKYVHFKDLSAGGALFFTVFGTPR